ncbi:histidine phosphatase family protein [Pseudonocardiaceae bacterium YIM PH 21723]|nr:histidine phosphatase family protein [Pseudonocardiaceae bacterium YIM PH 21723]
MSERQRLILVRHGQTTANVARLLDSKPPGAGLTELGTEQAVEAAERLAGEPVVAVYASVALRAQQTAAPIAARHDLPVQVLENIHELQIGPQYEGQGGAEAYTEFERVFSQIIDGDLDAGMPGGGETARQLLDRFLPAVAKVTAEHPSGTIVLVSHGAAIRLAGTALAVNLDAHQGLLYVPNAQQVVLEPEETAWRCREWTGIDFE